MRRWPLLLVLLLLGGCSAVKKKVRVEIPPAYQAARTATLAELVEIINTRYAALETLKVSDLKVEFESGTIEQGYVEEYRGARAYALARRPSSILVNILNPLTKSTLLAMASDGQEFEVWLPRDNKYLKGRVERETEEENPLHNVRPQHLVQGLLVEALPVGDPRFRLVLEETRDARFMYYVMALIDTSGRGSEARLVRKLWIERSSLHLVRQKYYDGSSVRADIRYSHPVEREGLLVNTGIRIERKRENYSIAFRLSEKGLRVNQPVRDGAFRVPQPPGAKVVVVEEKSSRGQSDANRPSGES